MNEEKLKQLKQGDDIFIRSRYKMTLEDGDVLFSHSYTSIYDKVTKTESFTHPENVILPSDLQPAPKYDPCRLFKKGDRVRVVEWSGRNPVLPFMDCKVGDIGTVIKDEEATSFFVRLHLEGKYEKDMPYCHLELVTPVEEQEPYYVGTRENMLAVYKKTQTVDIIISMFSQSHPHAKEAAEAERDRLNAEYGKEQNNGNQ